MEVRKLICLHLLEVFSHAEFEYPNECCGFICASGVIRCTNVLDELHTRLPAVYSRTSRTGFVLSQQDVRFLLEAEAGSNPVRVLYHSHPDREAYFSDEDRAFAIVDGERAYDVAQLVVSVVAGRALRAKLYAIENGAVVETASFSAE